MKPTAIALFALFLVAACATTKQASDVKHSGFLGDYSILQKGKEGQALLRYDNPNAQWKTYNKVMIDAVSIWTGPDSDLAKISAEERQKLANRFQVILANELGKSYHLVSAPGPNTLRIQAAITDADSSNPALNTVSTVMPIGLAVSAVTEAATGKPTFTGSASGEMKVSDAVTGEILTAAVDSRFAGKKLSTEMADKWSDAQNVLTYWAQQLAYKLCVNSHRTGCVAPAA
ncbi:MAG: DUF3313 domain-containing protein [Rickettsiales bacterium]